jgi:uncharacterized protein with von Willebrand factor type A (vWA) domain
VTEQREVPALMFEQREAQLAPLDALPRSLWLGSTINSQGSLSRRLPALQELRESLLAGRLPADFGAQWPDRRLAEGLCGGMLQLGLPGLCHDHPAIVDLVLGSMLWYLDLIVDHVDRGDSEDDAAAKLVQAFVDDWRERRRQLKELETVFGDAEDLLKNTHWDRLSGLLRSEGWQEVLRLRRLMQDIPELAELIQRLGRARPIEKIEQADQSNVQIMESSPAPCPAIRINRVPELAGETRGVHRSGRIARMLASESMLLTHPKLRLLWHARHAERSLLTYEEDDRANEVVIERAPLRQPSPRPVPAPRRESGPMLICVDTSGSMQGGAEAVAKAAVVETLRAAHTQKRACYLFAFGGPGEILETELRLDGPGIEQLTDFIGQGFRGGTDICGPLERVMTRLTEQRWQLADLLIASDGEFGATPETAQAIARAKAELGLRVQGVLVGDRETIGLLELADDIYWVRDWRHYGTSDAESPLHSKSLTALYFPNALRTPKVRPSGTGEDAPPPGAGDDGSSAAH